MPDPVGADPHAHLARNRRADIVAMLIGIYGSCVTSHITMSL